MDTHTTILVNKHEVIIDIEDLNTVKQLDLMVTSTCNNGYKPIVIYKQVINNGKVQRLNLARLLVGIQNVSASKKVILFENGNLLDLRKKNLRIVTTSEYRRITMGIASSDFGSVYRVSSK